MSVITKAGEAFLILRNEGRENASPPVTFPNFSPDQNFSFSIWVYPLGKRGDPSINMIDYAGTDGSIIGLAHNGFNWAYIVRGGSVAEATQYFDDVTYNRWACFCFANHGGNVSIYYGLQAADDQNPAASPVALKFVLSALVQPCDFFNFLIRLGSTYYLSNFKFWNDTLTIGDFQAQANRFDANPMGGVPPMWVSTLRTPGDLSNIVSPYTGPNWAAGHAFSDASDWKDLKIGGDPAYMQTTPCPTWIYPVDPSIPISFNPGMTPSSPTTYDCLGFQEFEDRGSLSNVDANLVSIEYFAYPTSALTGAQPTDHWPLFIDQSGINKIQSGHTLSDRFEQDTGVAIPGGIKISTMYAWKYGAQITWQPHVPNPIATAGSSIDYLRLFVVYTGIPTGVPEIPVQDLLGLFAVDRLRKSPGVDEYNRGVKLAIPAPTIRTAYLGQ